MCISKVRETFHDYKWSCGFILIAIINVTLRDFIPQTLYTTMNYGDHLMLAFC